MRKKKHTVPFFDLQFITSTISITMVLLLLGMVVFFVLGAHNLSVYVKENLNVSVILSDEIGEAGIMKLQKKLDSEKFVKNTEYISKQEALNELKEAMGADPEEFLGHNPFPASIEVKLHSDYANTDSLTHIEKYLEAIPNVQEVSYQKDLINAVNENIRNISLLLLGLAIVLTLVSFALINNTIRLTIYSKRFLIHTMKLVGASWGFIRKPFLVRNLWIGILSGGIADGILVGAAYWLLAYQPDLNEVITTRLLLQMGSAVLIFGLLITWLCAYISINKFLRMKAGSLYYI